MRATGWCVATSVSRVVSAHETDSRASAYWLSSNVYIIRLLVDRPSAISVSQFSFDWHKNNDKYHQKRHKMIDGIVTGVYFRVTEM